MYSPAPRVINVKGDARQGAGNIKTHLSCEKWGFDVPAPYAPPKIQSEWSFGQVRFSKWILSKSGKMSSPVFADMIYLAGPRGLERPGKQ